MKKVAFICVHNSCRSQIAEALCRVYRKDLISYSAGSEIKNTINQDAYRIMKNIYYDFNIEDPTDKSDEEFVKVIEEIKEKIIKLII